MEFKIPKVVDQEPIIAGFSLKIVVVIVLSFLGFLFTAFTHFHIAIFFPLFAFTFIKINLKFPGKGELTTFVSYQTGSKCIHIDKNIRNMLIKEKNKFENIE